MTCELCLWSKGFTNWTKAFIYNDSDDSAGHSNSLGIKCSFKQAIFKCLQYIIKYNNNKQCGSQFELNTIKSSCNSL